MDDHATRTREGTTGLQLFHPAVDEPLTSDDAQPASETNVPAAEYIVMRGTVAFLRLKHDYGIQGQQMLADAWEQFRCIQAHPQDRAQDIEDLFRNAIEHITQLSGVPPQDDDLYSNLMRVVRGDNPDRIHVPADENFKRLQVYYECVANAYQHRKQYPTARRRSRGYSGR